jgi:hypothetical protein
MLNKLAIVTLIAVASPALAQAMPHIQNDTLGPNLYHVADHQDRLIEGRYYGTADPPGYFASGRDQMVNATGN